MKRYPTAKEKKRCFEQKVIGLRPGDVIERCYRDYDNNEVWETGTVIEITENEASDYLTVQYLLHCDEPNVVCFIDKKRTDLVRTIRPY